MIFTLLIVGNGPADWLRARSWRSRFPQCGTTGRSTRGGSAERWRFDPMPRRVRVPTECKRRHGEFRPLGVRRALLITTARSEPHCRETNPERASATRSRQGTGLAQIGSLDDEVSSRPAPARHGTDCTALPACGSRSDRGALPSRNAAELCRPDISAGLRRGPPRRLLSLPFACSKTPSVGAGVNRRSVRSAALP
jgi:hypothetical protein